MILQTEHGTFEGESERDLLKASRKAARDAAKYAKLAEANRQVAYTKAEQAGYRLYRAWATRKPGESIMGGRWDVVTAQSDENTRKYFWRVEHPDLDHWTINGECYGGTATLRFFQWEPIALIWDGAGFLLGYFVRSGNEIVGLAIGVHEGVVETCHIPGIRVQDLVSA